MDRRDPRTDWIDLSVSLTPAHSQVPPRWSNDRAAEFLARDMPNMSVAFWAHHDFGDMIAGRMVISAN